MLGNALCEVAHDQWEIFALYRHRKPKVEGLNLVQVELTDLDALSAVFRQVRPRAVVHAAAASRVDECQVRPDETARINIDVTSHMAQMCADFDCDLVFTSTDLVFSGRNAPYSEPAVPHPVCEYGRQKAAAELLALRYCPQALVCRLPLLFGWGPQTEATFTTQVIDAVVHHRPLTLFVDEYRTPVDVLSAARGLLAMLGRVRGLLHLGGRTRMSRFDMGLMVAEALEIEPTMIRPVRIADVDLPFVRSPDCSLESLTAFGMGYDPTPFEASLKEAVIWYQRRQRVGSEGLRI